MQRITEIRFELPAEETSVLDGYCSAKGKSRADVMRKLLHDWSQNKRIEATVICRAAGINPTTPDRRRRGAE